MPEASSPVVLAPVAGSLLPCGVVPQRPEHGALEGSGGASPLRRARARRHNAGMRLSGATGVGNPFHSHWQTTAAPRTSTCCGVLHSCGCHGRIAPVVYPLDGLTPCGRALCAAVPSVTVFPTPHGVALPVGRESGFRQFDHTGGNAMSATRHDAHAADNAGRTVSIPFSIPESVRDFADLAPLLAVLRLDNPGDLLDALPEDYLRQCSEFGAGCYRDACRVLDAVDLAERREVNGLPPGRRGVTLANRLTRLALELRTVKLIEARISSSEAKGGRHA